MSLPSHGIVSVRESGISKRIQEITLTLNFAGNLQNRKHQSLHAASSHVSAHSQRSDVTWIVKASSAKPIPGVTELLEIKSMTDATRQAP